MADLAERYWDTQFNMTAADLDRMAERMRQDRRPIDLTTLVKHLVKGRLEHGQEPSPSVIKEWTGKDSVRLWDPASQWKAGDGIIVARDRARNGHYDLFVGEVIDKNSDGDLEIRLDGHEGTVTYACSKPGSASALAVHNFVIELAEKKYGSAQLEDQTAGIILKHGARIVSQLRQSLESDGRFVGLEGKWFLKELLPLIRSQELNLVYRRMLADPSVSDIKDLLKAGANEADPDLTMKMAVHAAMMGDSKRFRNEGTYSQPKWKAILPAPDEAVVVHYAYDPDTYQIICRPGQQPKAKGAEHLQRLDLYQHVVDFAK